MFRFIHPHDKGNDAHPHTHTNSLEIIREHRRTNVGNTSAICMRIASEWVLRLFTASWHLGKKIRQRQPQLTQCPFRTTIAMSLSGMTKDCKLWFSSTRSTIYENVRMHGIHCQSRACRASGKERGMGANCMCICRCARAPSNFHNNNYYPFFSKVIHV